jgi:hypothetical protein
MSSTAFIEPLPVIDFVAQLLNRDISVRPLSDSDRVKVWFIILPFYTNFGLCVLSFNYYSSADKKGPERCEGRGHTPRKHAQEISYFWPHFTSNKRAIVRVTSLSHSIS